MPFITNMQRLARASLSTVLVFLVVTPLHSAHAQVNSVEITRLEATSLGRGQGSSAMYVQHRVNYCLRGKVAGRTDNVIAFESKKLAQLFATDLASKYVRGGTEIQDEAMLAGEVRCGEFGFEVHADVLLSTLPFDASNEPRLVLRNDSGAVIATKFLAGDGRGGRGK